ncbi:MAG: efflux RND transporter periplasmic adaptor subunit, partial [Actinobacteria bacterium]|nr:efflux RND transporter periplasmic adaptor subunit [Actinomycetota bacterium]NIT98097.1 efflux RND transporter periplasmic adaptor subunit [Actinomycetota bacterium]NIV58264.1 efflux RND transporter periplasmic adaptor subunit [Actinomycetota bacterium]NIV89804.1 efflux RND transporter periplasmic adaptor subunit [Actinomycetota bacterium]NIX53075.1 efflux RND transporter periplasmic adaptor subunit [Actinomycetota bacterium]
PRRTFPAEIIFIAPVVEESIRRVPIKARAENPDALLRPGMFADLQVEMGRREAILLPVESVMNDPEGAFVWRVAEGDTVERAAVELGAREGERVEIRTGLATGDRVVTAGTHKVFPGAPVRAVEPPSATASGTPVPADDEDGA